MSVPSSDAVGYIAGWTSEVEVGSIVKATAISQKPLQDVLRDRGILACDLLEALPVAVYFTDAAGRLTFYNRAAADLWGWRPDPRQHQVVRFLAAVLARRDAATPRPVPDGGGDPAEPAGARRRGRGRAPGWRHACRSRRIRRRCAIRTAS